RWLGCSLLRRLRMTLRRVNCENSSMIKVWLRRFIGWGNFAEDLSLEIIYVQHVDSTPMRKWQNCKDINDLEKGRQSDKTIAKLWRNAHQYQLTLFYEDVPSIPLNQHS
ncbi:putative retrotransposon hot spot (RHS) protein, partial [Trypanosoma conorhini]